MKTVNIIAATSLSQLKALGHFREIKDCLELAIGNKLGVRDWISLYTRIEHIKEAVRSNNVRLKAACTASSFKESKNEISELLNLRITANDRDELTTKANNIINLFHSEPFNSYEYYEKTKLKKFKDSSKLEGIDINIPDAGTSLESILSKYRV